MKHQQLEFNFLKKTEIEEISEDLSNLSLKQENLRKGIFHRHSNLSKTVNLLQSEINDLKHQLTIIEFFVKGLKKM